MCRVCLDDFNEQNIFLLSCCDHVFHNECLREYYKTNIEESKFPLICPDEKCKQVLDQGDLSQILNENDMQKYLNFTFNQLVDHQ